MSRNLLIVTIIVVLVLLAGTVWTFQKKPTPQTSLPTINKDVKTQSDLLPTNKVLLGSQEFSKGKFEKEESGDIYVTDPSGKTLKFPLAAEIVFSCTTQDLKNATTFDFDLVTKVTVTTPSRLNRDITPGVDLVIMATLDKGTYFAHTLGIPEASCPK